MRRFVLAGSVAVALGAAACGAGGPSPSGPTAASNVAWARSVNGTATTYLGAVASFPDGSSVVVGSMEGAITFGAGEPRETTLEASDGLDGTIARYAADGALVWARRLRGPGYTGPARAVAVMTDGDVMVAGYFGYGGGALTLGEGEPNPVTLVSAGDDDAFLARYTGAGSLRWARVLGSTGVDQALALTALPGGALALAGCYEGTVTFGAGEPAETTLTGSSFAEAFVARFEPDGRLAWAKSTDALGFAVAWAVEGAGDGGVYVAGSFGEEATFGAGEPNGATLASVAGSDDVFVARLAPDGALLWARACGGAAYDEVWDLGVAPDGSVRVAGGFRGKATFGGEGPTPVVLDALESGAENAFLSSYGPDGAFQWARQTQSRDAGAASVGFSLAVDADGATVLAGRFRGTLTLAFDDATETTRTSLGGEDAFVARYRNDGALDWVETVGSVGDDAALGVSVLADGSLTVCGCYHGAVTFGAGDERETTFGDSGDLDGFVARFNRSGGF